MTLATLNLDSDYRSPLDWIRPFRSEWSGSEWAFIEHRFCPALMSSYRQHSAAGAGLLTIKRQLARQGFGAVDAPVHRGGQGFSVSVQKAIQFVCGYVDLDLRDAAHVAHGRMVLEHGTPEAHDRFDRRICGGELVAICATEERGGTDVNGFGTIAEPSGNGWVLRGEKYHVSRIEEASILVVFFRIGESNGLSAAVIDGSAPGISRERIQPDGLAGWSWGRISFHDVRFDEAAFLGGVWNGRTVFDDHFTYYRPMVTAAALGAASRIYDEAIADLRIRKQSGRIGQVLDSTLELLGRAHHEIESQIHYVLRMDRIGEPGEAFTRALMAKACAIDGALAISERLERILGARSFHWHSPVAKAMRDLRGYRFADGVHDALLRSAGRRLFSSGVKSAPKA